MLCRSRREGARKVGDQRQDESCTQTFVGHYADLTSLPRPPRGLVQKIGVALDLYPCEILFVHRDAESQEPAMRTSEIRDALSVVAANVEAIHVIPVRMTEAWFLFDESAIRCAAGNPNGKSALRLPSAQHVESLDAKRVLHQALSDASGLKGHRLQRYSPSENVHRVAELIDDFEPLRATPSFAVLEASVKCVLQSKHWQ